MNQPWFSCKPCQALSAKALRSCQQSQQKHWVQNCQGVIAKEQCWRNWTVLGTPHPGAVQKADLYDEVLIGDLAGMCMEQNLTSGQDSASACRVLPPMRPMQVHRLHSSHARMGADTRNYVCDTQ